MTAPTDTASSLDQTRAIHLLRRVVEDGWSTQRAAREMELPYAVVEQVLLDHGGPDKTRLRWALDELTHPAVPGDADTEPSQENTRPRPRFDPTAILARGLVSTNKTLVSRAKRLDRSIRDLDAALEADREAAATRARIEALRKVIAELEQGLKQRGGGSVSSRQRTPRKWLPDDDGLYTCPAPGCDRRTSTPQGIGQHHRLAHPATEPDQ